MLERPGGLRWTDICFDYNAPGWVASVCYLVSTMYKLMHIELNLLFAHFELHLCCLKHEIKRVMQKIVCCQ